MRGDDEQTGTLFSYVSCEARVPPDHPLRLIRAVVDEALDVLSPDFDTLYARVGRPGIAPEKLLRSQLLQVLYSIRSERQLMEQRDYNLLFRWFVGLSANEPVWTGCLRVRWQRSSSLSLLCRRAAESFCPMSTSLWMEH